MTVALLAVTNEISESERQKTEREREILGLLDRLRAAERNGAQQHLVRTRRVLGDTPALVEQDRKPFTRGQLALGVLGIDALLPTAEAGGLAFLLQLLQYFLHGDGLRGDESVEQFEQLACRRRGGQQALQDLLGGVV